MKSNDGLLFKFLRAKGTFFFQSSFRFFIRLMLCTFVNACLNPESFGNDEKIGSSNIVISTDLMNDLIAGSFG